jgi:hypothetical protein
LPEPDITPPASALPISPPLDIATSKSINIPTRHQTTTTINPPLEIVGAMLIHYISNSINQIN